MAGVGAASISEWKLMTSGGGPGLDGRGREDSILSSVDGLSSAEKRGGRILRAIMYKEKSDYIYSESTMAILKTEWHREELLWVLQLN